MFHETFITLTDSSVPLAFEGSAACRFEYRWKTSRVDQTRFQNMHLLFKKNKSCF